MWRGAVGECDHERCRCGAQPRRGLQTDGWPWLKSPFQPTQRNGTRGWFWRGSAQRGEPRHVGPACRPGPARCPRRGRAGARRTARGRSSRSPRRCARGSGGRGRARPAGCAGRRAPRSGRASRTKRPPPVRAREPADRAGRPVVDALAAEVEEVEHLGADRVAAAAAPGAVAASPLRRSIASSPSPRVDEGAVVVRRDRSSPSPPASAAQPGPARRARAPASLVTVDAAGPCSCVWPRPGRGEHAAGVEPVDRDGGRLAGALTRDAPATAVDAAAGEPPAADAASAQVLGDVPGPQLDHVAIRVGHVGGSAGAVEGDLLDLRRRARAAARPPRRSRPRRCASRSARARRRGRRRGPTCGRHSPIRVRSPAITQIASRSGQRSTTGSPSTPA